MDGWTDGRKIFGRTDGRAKKFSDGRADEREIFERTDGHFHVQIDLNFKSTSMSRPVYGPDRGSTLNPSDFHGN